MTPNPGGPYAQSSAAKAAYDARWARIMACGYSSTAQLATTKARKETARHANKARLATTHASRETAHHHKSQAINNTPPQNSKHFTPANCISLHHTRTWSHSG